jgi:hypothetical protein
VEPMTGAVGVAGVVGADFATGFFVAERGRLLFCASAIAPTHRLRNKMKMIFLLIKNLRLIGCHSRNLLLTFKRVVCVDAFAC